MKLIESSAEIMKEENPLIKIEKIGRICYKSDSDYTVDSAIAFIKSLIKRGHMSVLEHANFVFEGVYSLYRGKPFVKSTYVYNKRVTRRLISCNLRAIIENNYYDLQNVLLKSYPRLSEIFDMKVLSDYVYPREIKLVNINDYKDLTVEELNNHVYTSFLFVTDRGVTHEMVRHRIASYTQESTRYCNYSNDKFGREISCIIPADYESWDSLCKFEYTKALEKAESAYMYMINNGCTAQQARGVLPTNLSTTIVMTANHAEWEHFFDLRSRGKTGAPHPNMKKVASEAEEKYFNHYNNFEGMLYKENLSK